MFGKTLLALTAAAPLLAIAPNAARADGPRDQDDRGRQFDFRFGARSDDRHDNRPDRNDRDCPPGYRYVNVEVAPGYYRVDRTPPRYETRYDIHGRPFTVMVDPGGETRVWVPPVMERRLVRIDPPAPQPRPARHAGFFFDIFFGARR